ncbi:hypothetical protein C8R31_101111 [Nitrosospira sp. Nsp2]|nr:hypothetical protein C8R31_101111 [Nitrosospira sp. Nsp2]
MDGTDCATFEQWDNLIPFCREPEYPIEIGQDLVRQCEMVNQAETAYLRGFEAVWNLVRRWGWRRRCPPLSL